jgi:ribonuclease P protein component
VGAKFFARAAPRAASALPFEPGRSGLSRSDRLRGAAAFARVFHNGRRLEASRIELLVAPVPEGPGRIGYVIGRKQLPRAVDRNRLRRMLREALRVRRATTQGFDIVLRLSQTCAPADLPAVAAEARALLDSLALPTRR